MTRYKYAPLWITILLIGVSVSYTSCNKSDRDDDRETLSARDYALAHSLFDDAFRQVHKFAMRDTVLNDTSMTQRKDPCLKKGYISDSVLTFPNELVLNYGDEGKECHDQFTRYGTIYANYTGRHLSKGTTITIQFDGYRRGNYDVTGIVTVKNAGLNADARRMFTMEITDGLVVGPNTNIDFNADFVLAWVDGSSTEDAYEDDVFEVYGYAEGRNSRGSAFTNEITTRYESALNCEWFQKGRSAMTVQNLIPRNLNFETDSACDNLLYSRRNNTFLEVEIPD